MTWIDQFSSHVNCLGKRACKAIESFFDQKIIAWTLSCVVRLRRVAPLGRKAQRVQQGKEKDELPAIIGAVALEGVKSPSTASRVLLDTLLTWPSPPRLNRRYGWLVDEKLSTNKKAPRPA